MIHHAMSYAHRITNVMGELLEQPPTATSLALYGLTAAHDQLVAAESALVKAYGAWREGMQLAADAGSTKAAKYLEQSQWDLT